MPVIDPSDALLARIQDTAGLSYLSDLHDPAFKARVRAAVASIPEDIYPLEAWLVAISYILGSPRAVRTVADAKTYLNVRLL